MGSNSNTPKKEATEEITSSSTNVTTEEGGQDTQDQTTENSGDHDALASVASSSGSEVSRSSPLGEFGYGGVQQVETETFNVAEHLEFMQTREVARLFIPGPWMIDNDQRPGAPLRVKTSELLDASGQKREDSRDAVEVDLVGFVIVARRAPTNRINDRDYWANMILQPVDSNYEPIDPSLFFQVYSRFSLQNDAAITISNDVYRQSLGENDNRVEKNVDPIIIDAAKAMRSAVVRAIRTHTQLSAHAVEMAKENAEMHGANASQNAGTMSLGNKDGDKDKGKPVARIDSKEAIAKALDGLSPKS